MAGARYKTILQQTFISAFLSFLTFAFGFIRVSFFAKRMSMEEFGVLSLLLSYSAFLLYIFTLGSFQYLFKRVNDGEEAKRSGLWSSLCLTGLISCSAIVLAIIFSDTICGYLNISAFATDFKLAIIATATTAIAMVLLFYHYGQGRNNFQNLLQFLRGSLWVIITIATSFIFGLSLRQTLIVFNLCIFIVLLLAIPWKELRFLFAYDFRSISFKPLLKYCLPLLPYFAGVWGIPTVIRSQLNVYRGPSDVAMFSVAYNLMEIVFLFVSTITATLSPYFFAEAGVKEKPELMYNVMLKYSILLIILILPFVYLTRFDVIDLITSHKYLPAGDLIPLLIFLPLLRILVIVFEQVYLKNSNTVFLGSVYCVTILLALTLAVVLIPKYSIKGAIISSLVAYITLFLCFYIKSFHRVDYSFQKLFGVFGLTATLWITVLAIEHFHFHGFLKTLPVALIAAISLLVLPIFSEWEKQKFLSFLKIKYVS